MLGAPAALHAQAADLPPSGFGAIAIDKGSPVLFIPQQEKVTGTIAVDYRIVMVRRTK